jgi:hypothetical protein
VTPDFSVERRRVKLLGVGEKQTHLACALPPDSKERPVSRVSTKYFEELTYARIASVVSSHLFLPVEHCLT